MQKARTILVVDDEEIVRLNMAAFLEDEGFSVITACSAEDALEKAAASRVIDLAIVDMRLPAMDGNTLILHLHEMCGSLQFLIYTGSVGYHLPVIIERIGISNNDIFIKPILDMNILLEAIKHKLDLMGAF